MDRKVRRVAVIGAGPAGAIATDALVKEQAFETIRVFDRRGTIGGTWQVGFHCSDMQWSLLTPSQGVHASSSTQDTFSLGSHRRKCGSSRTNPTSSSGRDAKVRSNQFPCTSVLGFGTL